MPNYAALRQAHFRITLKAWWAGLDKALIALLAALQFMLTALITLAVYGLTQGLTLLLEPGTDLRHRVAVVVAWQALSFVLLRTLREAAFMPKARPFFDTLPVPRIDQMAADLKLGALCYSFLWLPWGWALAREASGFLMLASLAALSLCLNITVLRGAWRLGLLATAAGAAWTLAAGDPAAVALIRVAAALLAAWALWRSYLPAPARAASVRREKGAWQRLAIGSGLAIPLLANELRSNLLVRIGLIAASLGACLIVMALRTNDASTASVVVFVAAVATLALYQLPTLIRRTLLTRLHFVAGHPEVAHRMRLWVYGIPTALFAASLIVAWPFDRSGTAAAPALVFGFLYLAGAATARCGIAAASWLMPFATAVALIVMGAMW